jgi:hypothetical protein
MAQREDRKEDNTLLVARSLMARIDIPLITHIDFPDPAQDSDAVWADFIASRRSVPKKSRINY